MEGKLQALLPSPAKQNRTIQKHKKLFLTQFEPPTYLLEARTYPLAQLIDRSPIDIILTKFSVRILERGAKLFS